MTTDQTLDYAVLGIYAALSLPTIYVAFRHGFRALVAWAYLFLFCTLKIIGSGMQLSDSQSSGSAIIGSIGLSPLLLTTAGILHEA